MKTPQASQQVKFTIIKSCLARFSGIFAVGTPSNIHGTAISYRCAKFGAFVNSVTILTLRDLTLIKGRGFPSLNSKTRHFTLHEEEVMCLSVSIVYAIALVTVTVSTHLYMSFVTISPVQSNG